MRIVIFASAMRLYDCRKLISAFLAIGFIASALQIQTLAAGPRPTLRRATVPVRAKTSLAIAELSAERYVAGTRVVWKTENESNIVGYRVWRDEGGVRTAVSKEMVGGSLAKVRGGSLPIGDVYFDFDLEGGDAAAYWLEAVDVNSETRWFGPVYAQPNFFETDRMDAMIEGLRTRSNAVQTERGALEPINIAPGSPELASVSATALAGDPNALKMGIRNTGMYRISAQALSAFGFDALQAANWKLFMGGVEQPIKVNADGSVEFFGRGIDTIQTDENVYWLTSDVAAGTRIVSSNSNYQNNARDWYSRVTVELRERSYRSAAVLNGARENWFGGFIGNTVVNKVLSLRDVAFDANQTVTVGVDLQGISNIIHQVAVKLNGTAIGNYTINPYDRKEWTVNVPVSALLEGSNTISIQATNTTSDYVLSEAVRITYPRRLQALNNKLEFVHENNQPVKLRGFTSPNIRIFDVTNLAAVTETVPEARLETDGTYSFSVAGTSGPKNLIAKADAAASLSADPLIPNSPSTLRSAANEAKMVIITPTAFIKGIGDYAGLRTIRGVQTIVVPVEDIYDEFNNGVRSAEAIRDFLQYAKANWTVKPDYVILAGDSSSDPRNYSGLGGDRYNAVPTIFVDTWNIEAPSDESLVDFNNDGIGELAVGRLPAEDRDELSEMVEKLTYSDGITASDASLRGINFVSDDNLGYDFAAASRNMAATLPAGVSATFIDRAGQDPTVVRSNIISRINGGAAIFNFFGHGSVTSWTSAGILRNVDSASMFSPKRSTMVISLACLNGDNTVFGTMSLGESLMKRSRGGAFAVWAASGWNGAMEEENMGKDLYPRLFAGMTMGYAVREVKSRYPTIDMRRTFILFGDPSLPLIVPN